MHERREVAATRRGRAPDEGPVRVGAIVGPDVEMLTSQLHDMVPGEPIAARTSNDSIILTGTVSSPAAAHRAEQLARTFAGDKVVNMISVGSSQQVMLEVRFAEMTRASPSILDAATLPMNEYTRLSH